MHGRGRPPRTTMCVQGRRSCRRQRKNLRVAKEAGKLGGPTKTRSSNQGDLSPSTGEFKGAKEGLKGQKRPGTPPTPETQRFPSRMRLYAKKKLLEIESTLGAPRQQRENRAASRKKVPWATGHKESRKISCHVFKHNM